MARLHHLFGIIVITAVDGHASARPQPNVLRWAEGLPGCTFSADDDGRYRYGLWTDDFGIVIAVDADEVRKASLRVEPLFAIFVSLRYRGKQSLSFDPASIRLEFVSHYHAVQNAIDPDDFAAKLERDTGKKAEKGSSAQNDVKQTQEFLRSRGLRPIRLDSTNSEVAGWIFFSAKSKWIGDWKKQEQFLLRVPIAGQEIEFPFALPPSQGDVLLRRR